MSALDEHLQKESYVDEQRISADDADVQQVEGHNYDPARDKRDMKRLGKRQELKVGCTISDTLAYD